MIDNVCAVSMLSQQLQMLPAIIAKVEQSVQPEQYDVSFLLCGGKEYCNEVIRAQCTGKGYVQLHV